MSITSPTEIDGCVLWLDGADETSMTLEELSQDEIDIIASWGIDYNLEMKSINQWRDKSSSGININIEKSMRPKFYPNSFGDKSSLRFDGNDYFDLPDGLVNYEDMSFFLVGRCYDLSKERSVILTNAQDDAVEIFRITSEEGTDGVKLFRLEVGLEGGEDFINTYFPAAENVSFLYSLQSLKGFIEGRINTISTGVARTPSSGPLTQIRIGSGKGWCTRQGIRGFVGEIIFYNRAVSQTERQDLENYLINKWSIA